MEGLEYFHCAKCAFTRRFIECHYCMRCKEHCVCSPMWGLFEYVTGGVAAVLLIVSMTLFVAVAGILSAAAIPVVLALGIWDWARSLRWG